uniref:Uncharacterized protein n=1 Tax=Oryza nivara TaxID=4536 RepID=A0A0E0HLN4_ORYNI
MGLHNATPTPTPMPMLPWLPAAAASTATPPRRRQLLQFLPRWHRRPIPGCRRRGPRGAPGRPQPSPLAPISSIPSTMASTQWMTRLIAIPQCEVLGPKVSSLQMTRTDPSPRKLLSSMPAVHLSKTPSPSPTRLLE